VLKVLDVGGDLETVGPFSAFFFFWGGGGDKGLGINFVLRWFRLTGVFTVDLF